MSSKEQLISGETLNPEWFKSVTEKQAIQSLRSKFEVNSIIKAWKIANGKSVPNYLNDDAEDEKPKRTRKKKEDVDETEAQD